MKPLRVLIAEDEGLVAAGLKTQLEALGHHVVGMAKDGVEAVELTHQLSPDLVLLDLRMPRMDGIQAAKKINENHPTPIMFVTAHSDAQLAAEASKVGALGYLIKPVSGRQLQPAIEVAVSRFAEIESLRHSVDNLKEDIESRKLVERAKGVLMKRLRLDEGDAFGVIQRRSRNSRKPMAEIS